MTKRTKSWDDEAVELLSESWESLAPGVERFRMPGNEPVRRIITGRRNRRVGAFWSWKNSEHVAHESDGEERCARYLEVHPLVTDYWGQPEQLRITFDQDWGTVRYTPDFLVAFDSLELRVEYKRMRDLFPPEPARADDGRGWQRFHKAAKLRKRLSLVRAAYDRAGVDWLLLTDVDLDAAASPSTVDSLIANAGRPLGTDDRQRLTAFLRAQPQCSASLEQCALQLVDSEFPFGDILARVPERLLRIDLLAPVDETTTVVLMEHAR